MSKQRQQEGYGKSTPPKHLKAARFPKSTASRPFFLPSDLAGLELWCKYNSGITIAGAGVSQWDDVSGNGNHLKQGTDTNRPSKESDGSILFDGVDNFLKADAFTLVQPETIYLLAKQVTWTSLDAFFDGNTVSTGLLRQKNGRVSPDIQSFAGVLLEINTDFILNTYAVVITIFNGAVSAIQVNNEAPLEGDAGAANMGGFTLGTQGNMLSRWSHIQVKEVLIYSVAHDAATRLQMTAYLAQIGSLNI